MDRDDAQGFLSGRKMVFPGRPILIGTSLLVPTLRRSSTRRGWSSVSEEATRAATQAEEATFGQRSPHLLSRTGRKEPVLRLQKTNNMLSTILCFLREVIDRVPIYSDLPK